MPETTYERSQASSPDVLIGLAWGEVRILLPGELVRDLEHAMDVDPAGAPVAAAGWLTAGAVRWPVFALDHELRPDPTVAAGRKVCALVAIGAARFGLLCDSVAMYPARELKISPLPLPMRLADSPVDALVLLENRIALVADALRLTNRLGLSSAEQLTETMS